jgi:cell division protein FtsB
LKKKKLHYASIQSEIDGPSETDLLKQCISELKAENDKIRAENVELKIRIAKLEDKQTQNELTVSGYVISLIITNK